MDHLEWYHAITIKGKRDSDKCREYVKDRWWKSEYVQL